MIEFREPKLEDRAWATPLLRREGIPLSAYGFHTLCCWKGAYHYQIARLDQRMLIRLDSSLGPACFWPVGSGDPHPALEALAQQAHDRGEPLRFVGLSLWHRNWLEDCCPGRFTFLELRDASDYLYSVDRLADLPGKKLHAKRNHIRRLDDRCPGWRWDPITTRQDVTACLAMDQLWQQSKENLSPEDLASRKAERKALRFALLHREELGMEGVILRWGSKILGFSLGAPLTQNVFDVSFERARADIQGAYPAVNRSFAQYIRKTHPEISYLDREEDMGIPGLRKAKLSYYPDYLQVNFCAVETAAV